MVRLDRIYNAPKYDTVKEYINNSIKIHRNDIAFVIKNKSGNKYTNITYKKMGEDIKELGTGLIKLGLQNKRIAVVGNNSYSWAITYLATLCGVGIIVPLDKGLQPSEIEMCIQRSKVDAIVFDENFEETFRKMAKEEKSSIKYYISMNKNTTGFRSLEEIKKEGKKLLNKGDKRYEKYKISPDAMATIIFTSGTTSMSKAVMLSNRNLATNLYDLLSTEYVDNKDVNMLFLPLHHTFGSTGMLYFLCNGTKNVFCDGLRYIQSNLQEYKVTTFVCVPLLLESMYKNIWKNIEKQNKTKLIKFALKLSKFLLKFKIDVRRKLFKPILDGLGGEIRFIISGASSINKEVAQGFNDFGILTVQGYGLTESSPVLTAENINNIKIGSVGLPFPSVDIEIRNKNEDGIGEIVAKAPNVMLGYYEMKEETEKVLQDGWFSTGDLGYIDEEGYLFITGRKKNVIVLKNGKNVYPEEIEQLISNFKYVSEVMVFGKPKDDDVVVSVKIVYNKEYVKQEFGEITEEELKEIIWKDIKEVNKTLPKYKYIKNLIIQDTPMVKTTTAKIKRFEEIKK